MTDRPNRMTYKDAGVDIEAGNELVDRIKPAVKSTDRTGVMGGIGGFGGLFDLKAAGYQVPILVAATDGVGTKLRIAIDTGHVGTVGIDLVAMCVNDLVCQGAEPLFFLDYFATGKLSVDHGASVVEGIAEGCRQAGCALIGGETAEMPGMYADGDFDLAGFSVGAMERGAALPRDVAVGDVLIGLPSSGVHSNGYSLVRKIVATSGLDWASPSPFGKGSLGEALLAPTRVYVLSALDLIREAEAHAFAHITGGGLTENIPRMLPEDMGAEVDLSAWNLPPIFRWLAGQSGLEQAEALRTFNCGVGMVAALPEAKLDQALAALSERGETAFRIGRITDEPGMKFTGSLL